jgi:hypothetical protein
MKSSNVNEHFIIYYFLNFLILKKNNDKYSQHKTSLSSCGPPRARVPGRLREGEEQEEQEEEHRAPQGGKGVKKGGRTHSLGEAESQSERQWLWMS